MHAILALFKFQFVYVCMCVYTHIYICKYIFHGISCKSIYYKGENVKSGGLFLKTNSVQLNYYFSSQHDKANWEFPDVEGGKNANFIQM